MITGIRIRMSFVMLLALACTGVSAQTTPFFNRGVAAFEPEIDTVTTGDQITVAPTVSADRKYVTIGGQFQSSRVLRIETVTVQSFTTGGAPGGLVGQPRTVAPDPSRSPNINVSPPLRLQHNPRNPILHQSGLTFVAPLSVQ